MKYISLPDERVRPLPFYLAMEEYVAHHLSEPDAFFMWQVAPTVICGRNQVVENEVNLDYCREHGIHVVRRKSGGGCVYADMDNVMLSYVTTEQNVGIAFNSFVNMVLLVLRKMGVKATGTSHNDIMIGERKVCGTACYQFGGGCIVHSTLLYDTNMEHKGIQSVRQRITLLKDYTPLGLEEIKTLIRETLCEGERTLSSEQVAEIEKMKD